MGSDAHATEHRLMGQIQAMMSDTALRGKVYWLLMTARIHLLSPDIRKPVRVGDLIIPALDPQGEDKRSFLRWMIEPIGLDARSEEQMEALESATGGYFAAAYASLRSELIATNRRGQLNLEGVMEIMRDHIPPAIGKTRSYQTLRALLNCTRSSLLPDPNFDEQDREAWRKELRQLESEGVS
jgi:hypothetical protein